MSETPHKLLPKPSSTFQPLRVRIAALLEIVKLVTLSVRFWYFAFAGTQVRGTGCVRVLGLYRLSTLTSQPHLL